MALMEHFFPVMRSNDNFFDRLTEYMAKEVQEMEVQMENMRKQMFHLLPQDQVDVTNHEIVSKHPVVEEKGESKLKLEFNVKQFKPEEVQVKLLGNNILQIFAEHAEHNEGGGCCSKRVYLRKYSLPQGVDTENIRPILSKDGVLTIEAPAPPLSPKEKMIPIEYRGKM